MLESIKVIQKELKLLLVLTWNISNINIWTPVVNMVYNCKKSPKSKVLKIKIFHVVVLYFMY